MLTITSRAQLRRAILDARLDVHLRALLRLRFEQLGGMGAVWHLVQPGDTLGNAEIAIGWPMLDDGEPCWEWTRAHPGGWHEITFITGDGDPAQVLIVGPDACASILDVIRAHT